jgi:hypothetical protein
MPILQFITRPTAALAASILTPREYRILRVCYREVPAARYAYHPLLP